MRRVTPMVNKLWLLALAAVVTAPTLVFAQGGDVNAVLASARQALGGDKKLDAVKTLTIAGRTLRTNPTGTSTESEFEMAVELPDKYMRRDVVVNMGNMSIYRTSGFNGDGVINETDTPPQLAGGGAVMMFRSIGPGGALGTTGGAPPTPEQQDTMRRAMLNSAKQDFTRLALGVFVKPTASYPLTMTLAGQAESPDGRADIIEVKGEGDFVARLFVDTATHLPLMLSWMAKEPMQFVRTAGGPGGPGGGNVVTFAGGVAHTTTGVTSGEAPRPNMTPEEREKMIKAAEAQMKEAEAKRKMVEYRLFYSDYRTVGGIQIPHRLQRSIDGKPTEEVTFDQVKVNPKIDPKKFTISK